MLGSWKGINSTLFSSLSDQINDCALDINRWNSTLLALCQNFDLCYSNLCLFDRVKNAAGFQNVIGIDAELESHLAYFREYEIPKLARALDTGAFAVDELNIEDLTTRNALSLNAYGGSLVKLGVTELLTLCILHEPKRFAVLILGRTRRDNPLDDEVVSLLRAFSPSLRRALILEDRFNALQSHLAFLNRGLDLLAFGTVGLDTAGNIRSSNSTAQRMLADGVFIRSIGGRLCGANRQASDDLMRAIKQVAMSAQMSCVDVALPGATASEGTIACVIGLSDNILSNQAQSAAIIFIADPALIRRGSTRLVSCMI